MSKIVQIFSISQRAYIASFLLVFFVFQYVRVFGSIDVFEHGYWLANKEFQMAFNVIVCLLPLTFVVLSTSSLLQKWKLTFGLIAVPLSIFFGCFLLGMLASQGVDSRTVQSLSLGDGVEAKLYVGGDAFCPKYDTMISPSKLILARTLLNGSLVEYKVLIYVNFTQGSRIRLLDNGRKIRFSDGSGTDEIVRVVDSGWNSTSNSRCERINR